MHNFWNIFMNEIQWIIDNSSQNIGKFDPLHENCTETLIFELESNERCAATIEIVLWKLRVELELLLEDKRCFAIKNVWGMPAWN